MIRPSGVPIHRFTSNAAADAWVDGWAGRGRAATDASARAEGTAKK